MYDFNPFVTMIVSANEKLQKEESIKTIYMHLIKEV